MIRFFDKIYCQINDMTISDVSRLYLFIFFVKRTNSKKIIYRAYVQKTQDISLYSVESTFG